MYAVILAGGGGTRLWPLSTPDRPKPFIPLLGEETLFERTVRRLRGPELGAVDVFVVTDRPHARLVREQAPDAVVLEEPTGRNTAAAIALATVGIDRPDDEVMVVLPADHVVEREDVFRGVLRDAAAELACGAFGIDSPLVTLGIQVDRSATEYGYLIPDRERGQVGRLTGYPLHAFEEKPTPERAQELRDRGGGIAWNAGMFIWRRRAIRAALAAHAADIIGGVASAHASGTIDGAYPSIRATSIDYAVMEPAAAAGRVVMAAMDVGWTDLGGWTVLLARLGARGDGRVVQAGEPAEAGPDDLVVRRRGGRLSLEVGPASGILDADGPSALLVGGRPDRAVVEALIERVSAREGEPS